MTMRAQTYLIGVIVALCCQQLFERSRAEKIETSTTNSIRSISDLIQAGREAIKKMDFLENLTKEQVVPDVIDTQPKASIKIKYNSGAEVVQGAELTPTQVKDLPSFSYEARPDELYTLAMVDPDAPSRKEPKFREILHYLVANIPGGDVIKGDTLAEYIGSGAPQGTGLHRYVFLLFKQSKGKLTSDIKISKNSRVGRMNFSIRNFAKQHNLGEPVAANFYQAQYDDYVPILHAQLAAN